MHNSFSMREYVCSRIIMHFQTLAHARIFYVKDSFNDIYIHEYYDKPRMKSSCVKIMESFKN